jgi:hypothetical protein
LLDKCDAAALHIYPKLPARGTAIVLGGVFRRPDINVVERFQQHVTVSDDLCAALQIQVMTSVHGFSLVVFIIFYFISWQ